MDAVGLYDGQWKADSDDKEQCFLPSFTLPFESRNRGLLLIDAANRIASADSSIFRLLDVPPGELLGRDIMDAVRGCLKSRFQDSEDYEASFERIKNNPEEIIECVLEPVGLSALVIHRYSAPIFDQHNKLVGRVEVYSDITKRRMLELGAQRAYEQLKATQQQLIQTEKLRSVGEIASGVAHDFNNTLGIILGNIQLLLRTVEDEKARSRLKAAERAALDAAETVRRIQTFTRTTLQSAPVVVDLGVVVSQVVEMTKPAWKDVAQVRGAGVDIVVDTGEAVRVLGDGSEIREVLINIALNAIQAMPNGGLVQISTGRSKSWGWVKIQDNGVGMSGDVRQRIFDPFFTTRGVDGTGLGMSVAYGIIKHHNGRIAVDSEVGQGTVVTVFLPSAQDGAPTEQAATEQALILGQPARVLVVDDEEMFGDVIAEMLTECGHAVIVARSGGEALERFKEGGFDMVFTDLGMPQMSGLQLAKALKEIKPRIPVALLTGWGEALAESDIAETCVDVTLSKPIKLEKLSSVVGDLLGFPPSAVESPE